MPHPWQSAVAAGQLHATTPALDAYKDASRTAHSGFNAPENLNDDVWKTIALENNGKLEVIMGGMWWQSNTVRQHTQADSLLLGAQQIMTPVLRRAIREKVDGWFDHNSYQSFIC